MPATEWTKIWHNPHLDVGLMQAYYIDHAFPRHSHDYYVVCLVRRGVQSFTHQSTKYYTPPGGLILINPEAAHTGEAAGVGGFEMLCIYPTAAHMAQAVFELTGRSQDQPFFKAVRADDPGSASSLLAAHKALAQGTDPLESESAFIWTLAQLIQRYADLRLSEQRLGNEHDAIWQARRYIEERFAQGISLSELATHVSLSPYYLLRAFRAEVGMPPHAYLESVRILHAQRLIDAGRPLAEVAAAAGFSSQSHLTERFKQIIGVTPGQYAQERK